MGMSVSRAAVQEMYPSATDSDQGGSSVDRLNEFLAASQTSRVAEQKLQALLVDFGEKGRVSDPDLQSAIREVEEKNAARRKAFLRAGGKLN